MVDVRKMIRRHIVNERAVHLVVANPSVKPTEEQCKLHEEAENQRNPIRIEKFSHFLTGVLEAVCPMRAISLLGSLLAGLDSSGNAVLQS